LDERQRRLLLGAEARVLGHGGIRRVATAAGVAEGTVSRGVADLEGGDAPLVRVTARTHRGDDEDGHRTDVTEVTITNVGDRPTPALLARADVRRGTAAGTPLGGDDQVLPVLWSDNDVTLWPGESQTITAMYRHDELRGAAPVVSIGGWNIAGQVVRATGDRS
jgi:hypothetical protein